MALSKCASSKQSWTVRKSKLTLNAITGADEIPIIDPDEAASKWCQHWSSVLWAREADIPGDQTDATLSFAQLAQLVWLCSRSCWPPNVNPLTDQMGSLSVYSSEGRIGAKFCVAAYQATLQGWALPAGFGASRTVFISKSSEGKAQELLVLAPESLRPSTL